MYTVTTSPMVEETVDLFAKKVLSNVVADSTRTEVINEVSATSIELVASPDDLVKGVKSSTCKLLERSAEEIKEVTRPDVVESYSGIVE